MLLDSERAQVPPRRPFQGEVRHDPADHAAELEPVARESGGDEHVLVVRMAVEDEVPVRAVGEHARRHPAGRTVRPGKASGHLVAV